MRTQGARKTLTDTIGAIRAMEGGKWKYLKIFAWSLTCAAGLSR
jgi:hypothetical protein